MGKVRTIRIMAGVAVLVAGTLAGGCATAPDPLDKEAVAEFEEINDPAEPTMRAIFSFNRGLDRVALKPLARVYKDVLPVPVQRGVYNFLNNLRSPIVFANDILQGSLKRAGTTLVRFLINTTAGIGGIGDVARDLGFEHHDEDFGQTLAVWGVPEGPYVMLPLFGPSNPRDAVGLVVDFLADPLNRWAANTDRDGIIWARAGSRAVSQRARHFDAIEDLEKSSLDYYAAVRSLYRQRRADEISNGRSSANVPAPGLSGGPSFDDDDEVSRTR